ncbi:MAG: carboxypeptidase-like regulatory domain-containing protein [Blastocatellia bacterium]|nr:carboxypeptidase-like regulatory domain-containing protein [Blastocatellia bacterium]
MVDLENGGSKPFGPIAGATVVASSSERLFEAVTGGNGKYSFSGIPPGKYTVRVTLPPKLSPIEEETVEVHDRGCAEINYNAVTDGRISGRLLDAQARPLKSKSVSLLPIGRGGEPLRPLWAFTEEDGSFQFKNLPPGRYLLGVNIAEAPDEKLPYKKTFYPSTPVQSKAEVFLLGEGQHLTGIDFRLPSPLIARTIQGQVVWPDGRPAVKAEVRLEDLESGRSAHWPAKTGTDGRFTFSGFEGVTYKMVATIPADPNWNPDSGNPVALLVSNAVEFTPSAQTKPVRLIINVDGDGIKRTRSTIGPRTTQKSRKKP